MMPETLRDEELNPEIISSEVVFDGAVWDVRSDRFRYGDSEITRHYVDHTGAVAIVAIDENDRVLLIQQYRHPIRSRDWELPAGLLDIEGEEPLLAAQRELAEETDLIAADWKPLLSTFTTPGGSNEIVHFFLATGLSDAPDTHARTEEEADIRVEWVPLADAVTAVLDGRMRNALLANGVLAASLRRAER
ncbi:ADP-ribose pyrophosphatase [Microbacterium sp. CH12i]|uniref:NUDIX domain-containing protein n=1 Tax=Microbacterium sp. CH12i TaxID=1479651 RepID=UPI000461DC0A|nr:NUDIX hydrolase [Microbacterium sp. CH12i]KDA07114.1 ADP-ribose pyrophosphatase [Microbacterium sp. CH12i]